VLFTECQPSDLAVNTRAHGTKSAPSSVLFAQCQASDLAFCTRARGTTSMPSSVLFAQYQASDTVFHTRAHGTTVKSTSVLFAQCQPSKLVFYTCAHGTKSMPSFVLNAQCQASNLGYTCVRGTDDSNGGGVRIHFSVSNSRTPPQNACTQESSSDSNLSQEDTLDGFLHVAVESKERGYVSLAFAKKAVSTVKGGMVVWK